MKKITIKICSVFLAVTIGLFAVIPAPVSSAISEVVLFALGGVAITTLAGLACGIAYGGGVSAIEYNYDYLVRCTDNTINGIIDSAKNNMKISYVALKTLINKLRSDSGFTDENMNAVINGTYNTETNSTYEFPQYATLSEAQADIENVLTNTFVTSYTGSYNDLVVIDSSSNPSISNPELTGPFANVTNFGNSTYYNMHVEAFKTGIRIESRVSYYNGEFGSFDVILAPLYCENWGRDWFVNFYNPILIGNETDGYKMAVPYWSYGYSGNTKTLKGISYFSSYKGHAVYPFYGGLQYSSTDTYGTNMITIPNSAGYSNFAQFATDVLMNEIVETPATVNDDITYDETTGVFTNNTKGVTYDPSKDITVTNESIANATTASDGQVIFSTNDIIDTTVQEYSQAVESGISAEYTYSDSQVQNAIDSAVAETVYDTPLTEGQDSTGVFTQITDWLRSILDKLQGIETDTGTIADELTNTTSQTAVDDLSISSVITTKFPFCIPWDVYNCVSQLAADPVPPDFSVVVPLPNNLSFPLEINFDGFELPVKILRYMLSIMFVLCLIIGTKKLIN